MTAALGIIGFPLFAFFLLLGFGKNLRVQLISLIGVAGIAFSLFSSIILWQGSLPIYQHLWNLLPAGLVSDGSIDLALKFDSLSMTMTLVVTFVSTLIAIYSSEYMQKEPGLARFFASMNLFVFFMLLLVLADNLWLLFIGWEGVGLASYMLIGFFYREPKAVSAAMKAFLTTRVGDVFLLFGIFCALAAFGTLNIEDMASMADSGSTLITITGLCLLLGACGKSAQLPLHTWLADAMWGPTPVSALIHAATMVAAGVYLLVRMSFLVVLSPFAQIAIMILGLATLIMAGLCALVQTDMKRVLAFSTMSQLGYMFLAVGALSFQSAIFHLTTHAFFKALLFLSAGIIGHSLHTYDLNQMGGLRKSFPAVFGFFLIGLASLMGLPLLGAGFFSKEWILNDIAQVPTIGTYLFVGAVFGTLLTALYSARMLKMAFFGHLKKPIHDISGIFMYATLFVLALFSLFIGWLETPHFLASIHLVSDFLSSSVPKNSSLSGDLLWLIPSLVTVLGILIAFGQKKGQKEHGFIKNGFGFDSLYQAILLRPYDAISQFLKPDHIKESYDLIAGGLQNICAKFSKVHTGRLQHYLPFMMFAMVALSSIMVLSCY